MLVGREKILIFSVVLQYCAAKVAIFILFRAPKLK